MDLIVDVGNTRIKVAVFEDGSLKEHISCEQENLIFTINKILTTHDIKRRFFSSVKNNVDFLETDYDFVALNRGMRMPFENHYKTKDTLGLDRLALAASAIKLYSGFNTLVIDAGSCVTYDFVNSSGEYLGGAISPGLLMRYKAMNNFTDGLPLLDSRLTEIWLGKTTETSMRVGAERGLVLEIDGMISHYKNEFENLRVLLTGGDAFHLASQLKNSIFANQNLVLEGLESIMTINLD